MAGYTDYLNLYYKNPRTDGADTFNIETMMNDNWDKIDEFASMVGLPDSGKGLVYVKCIDAYGHPFPRCVVQINGSVSVSSKSGIARFSLVPGEYQAIVFGPIDYGIPEETITVKSYNGSVSNFTVTIDAEPVVGNQITITKSCVCTFSDRVVSADAFGIGGGGSGGVARNFICLAATGGAGGKTQTRYNIDTKNTFFVTVGAGGDSVSCSSSVDTSTYEKSGKSGGYTEIKTFDSVIIRADGGEGGKGGYSASETAYIALIGSNGGSGSGAACVSTQFPFAGNSGENGSSGEDTRNVSGGSGQGTTTCSFGEQKDGESFASAGGSISRYKSNVASGSAGTGAGTPANGTSEDVAAGSAQTAGSGGGAAIVNGSGTATSGSGAPGLVMFRWEVA